MTTALDAVTIDTLCTTLGLRPPVGLRVDTAPEPAGRVAALNDEQLTALQVLAEPEAIAVVAHRTRGITFFIATRGDWVAEHVIEGHAHHLYARDAVNAPALLLQRTGFDGGTHQPIAPIDVTLGSYRRTVELLRAGDRNRAEAALLADGASPNSVDAFVTARLAGRVDMTGLAHDGRRYVGCELSIAGDDTTGRWHVPANDAATSPSRRVRIEVAHPDDLVDDLALIFGDAVSPRQTLRLL